MIRALRIYGYQSHKRTELEFDPGVNAIVGPSDSGKSAIIRALNWVLNNRPIGDAFVRDEKGCLVVIEPEHDCSISRKKTKKENYYYLNIGDSEETFKAIKTDVPEEIAKLLNTGPINIQYQHDSVFLLSSSPGEVAKYFNKTVDLEQIDRAQTNIERKLKTERAELKHTEIHLEELEGDLEGLSWLDKVEPKIQTLKMLSSKIHQTEVEKVNIHSLIKLIKEISEERNSFDAILGFETLVDILSELGAEISRIRASSGVLGEIVKGLKENQMQANVAAEEVKFEADVDRLLELSARIDSLDAEFNNLNYHIYEVESRKERLELTEVKIESLENKFEEMMPDKCPFFDEPCPLKERA